MDKEALTRRVYRTMEIRESKSTLEGGSWKGCVNIRNRELVIYSYEQRRMEVTFKDSYRAVKPMIILKTQGQM
jgi:hypothetical protein